MLWYNTLFYGAFAAIKLLFKIVKLVNSELLLYQRKTVVKNTAIYYVLPSLKSALILGLLDACTGSGWMLLFVAILEVVLVSWVYGVDKIFAHIEEMEIKIPTFMKLYWRVCWKYLTPGNPTQIITHLAF